MQPDETADCTAVHSNPQHSTAQHSTAQHSTAQHSTAQPSTAQPSPAQPSPAQPSPAQPSPASHALQLLCIFAVLKAAVALCTFDLEFIIIGVRSITAQ